MSDATFISTRFEIGRVIRQTFGVIGRNPASILLLCLAIVVASTGATYLVTTATASVEPQSRAVLTGSGSAIINVVLHAFVLGSVTLVALNDLNGQRTGFGQAVGTGLRLLFPVAGLTIVADVGIGLASMLLVVPGLLLLLRWFVVVPVRVMEGPGVGHAMSRSTDLTKGHRWTLFALLILYGLIAAALSYGPMLATGGLLRTTQLRLALDPAALALQIVSTVALYAISTSGTAATYAELVRIKEGALPYQLATVFE